MSSLLHSKEGRHGSSPNIFKDLSHNTTNLGDDFTPVLRQQKQGTIGAYVLRAPGSQQSATPSDT